MSAFAYGHIILALLQVRTGTSALERQALTLLGPVQTL